MMESGRKIEGEPRRVVYIMRGISGSGKSTKARELAGNQGVIHSTDDYFLQDGKYVHDITKIKENHARNQTAFEQSLAEGKPVVVLDNTNAQRFEYEPYAEMAKKYGYKVIFSEMPLISTDEAFKRNKHDVPREIIDRQRSNWDESITG